MITWKIVTIACMLAQPADCWTTEWPRSYTTYSECQRIIDHPYIYLYDGPVKVEGSKWVAKMCKGEVTQ